MIFPPTRSQRSLGLIYGLTALVFVYATVLLLYPPIPLRSQLADYQSGHAPWAAVLLTIIVTLFVASIVCMRHSLASAVMVGRIAVWLGWTLYLCILSVLLLNFVVGSQWLESSFSRALLELAATLGLVLLQASYGVPLLVLCIATVTTFLVQRRLHTITR